MAKKYTLNELNTLSREDLMTIVLSMHVSSKITGSRS